MASQDQSRQAAVVRILSSKCHYSMLGVSRSCSPARIRQTYRQLALTFHPDKNKCEGAVEAFQAIGNAYEVLSDNERRQQYDRQVQDEDDLLGNDYMGEGTRSRYSQDEEKREDDDETYGRRQFYYTRRYGG
eukprot:TRINITY_DN15036_c0_g1_i2.p1 TRINITY_DN15036_c0_g1~~TRINITY_DN15036_c0_g1_i2.p1  ORF type:complete len:145 (+),score=32.96 TRINITY_DN15036_c0_g1_i2:42-437(+)